MGAWSPSSERRALSRSLTSPGALSEPGDRLRAAPLLSPPAPGTRARAWRAWDGEGKRRDREPGCLARGVIGTAGFAGAVRLTLHGLARPAFALTGTQGHLSPGSGGHGMLHPSSLAPYFAGPVSSFPSASASLAPPPTLSAGYFYPLLVPRCFGGYSGEANPNPLSWSCAP